MHKLLVLLVVLCLVATATAGTSVRSLSIGRTQEAETGLRAARKVLKKRKLVPTKGKKAKEVVVQANAADAPNATLRGALCIIGGFMVHLTLGTVYCWGNFMSYSPPSLKFFDGKDHPGQQPDALFIIPFTIASQSMMVPVGPIIAEKLGARNAALLGSNLAALAVYLSSFQTSLGIFTLLYAVMFGCSIGMAYTAPMIGGWKWLPSMKGLVSGTILGGFGIGGFIFSLLGSKMMNPDKANPVNGRFPDSVYESFAPSLRKLSVMYAVVATLGALLVTEPAPVAKSEGDDDSAKEKPWGMSLQEAFKTKQFWLLWLMIVCSGTAGLNVSSVYKLFATTSDALAGDEFQALCGGIGAIFNGVGRISWGILSDMIGFKNSYLALTVLQAAMLLTYNLSTGSKTTYLLNTCLLYLCLAGNFSLIPAGCQRIFGPNAGGKVYGMLYSGFAVASISTGTLAKKLVKSVGWSGVFQTLAILSSIAFALTTLITPTIGWPQSTV